MLGGEAPTKESLKQWYGQVKVMNGYGPAEAMYLLRIPYLPVRR